MGTMNGLENNKTTILAAGSKSSHLLSSLVSDLSFWELQPIQEEPHKLKTEVSYLSSSSEGSESDRNTTKTSSEETELPAPPPETVWKAAVDPVSGRTYYYDAITRKSQWEKPEEIRAMERAARREKRRQDKLFFDQVKRNILASLKRGELIPGVAREQTTKTGPPMEPLNATVPVQRVRTISGMNEKLLAEIQNDTPAGHHLRPVPSSSSRPPVEGRPPLPRRGLNSTSNSHDFMELSPDTTFSKRSDFPPEDTLAGELQGEHLLDGPIMDEQSTTTIVAAKSSSSSTSPPSAHVRRNTGGTIYVKSTMENPDINATIKCVCGVYRAHVVQAAMKPQRSPVSVMHTSDVNFDFFRDDYETNPYGGIDAPVPSLAEIEIFYHDFFLRSQMEHDTIIMSLIYVERLIKATNGALAPSPNNWRSILFSCMVLSSKVWDDLSMFNLDFSNVSMASGLSSFSLQRTNSLEISVLQCLNFDVKVPASEYAKYYFLIRTMLTRSGLLDNVEVPLKKREFAKTLEARSGQYQDLLLNSHGGRRARSVDWSFLQPRQTEPVLKDTVCLEQLVSMDR